MNVRLALVAGILATAVLAAGCGSDDNETPPATQWASDVCTAVSTWADSLRESASSFQGGNISADGLKSAAGDVKSATDTLADDLKGVGKPDTEAGAEAQSAVEKLGDDLSEQADTIESAVDDVSGVNGVLGAVSTVTGALATMSAQVTATVDQLAQLDPGGELRQAFDDAPPCQDLRQS
jgi:methyl-accepting chemotaxis protein